MGNNNKSLSRKRKQKSNLDRILIGITIAITILITLTASLLVYIASTNDVYQDISETEMREEQVSTSDKDPISVLLIGTDQRPSEEDGTGRADALMVVTVNPQTGEAYVVSIPRDSYAEIPGYGYDKINHAYTYGGEELMVKTVEQFLDIPIDYYVRLNFEGFEQLVDAMGGVTVYNDFAFEEHGSYFPEGELHLNGHDALNYCRMRKQDPNGDFGRQERQAEVIASLIESAKEMDSVDDVTAVLDQVDEGNIATNVTPQEIWDIMDTYAPNITNVTYLQLDYYSYQPADVWYAKIDDEDRLEVTNKLRSNLGLELRPRSYYIDKGWDIPEEKPHGKAIGGDETAEDIHDMQYEQYLWEQEFLNSLYAGEDVSDEGEDIGEPSDSYYEEETSAESESYYEEVPVDPEEPVEDPEEPVEPEEPAEPEDPVDPDTDGDGIPDSEDEYPNDPNNQPPPVDTDGDGIPDSEDPDADGDGIEDAA